MKLDTKKKGKLSQTSLARVKEFKLAKIERVK